MSVDAIKNIKVNRDLKAIRTAREKLGISRLELAESLGISYKAVEKIENGRMPLSQERKEEILNLLGIDEHRLKRIKKAGVVEPSEKLKNVFENCHRRSYQRIITKEVRVLKYLRTMKNLPQDKASEVCGYSRPTIGHIENGRIEVPVSRIRYIVQCYGYVFSEFEKLMKEEILRNEIIDVCTKKLISLPEDKLKIVQSLLANF